MEIKTHIRDAAIALGRQLPRGTLQRLGNMVRELELSEWMTDHNLIAERIVENREALFDLVGSEIGSIPVLYLEFGVANGVATQYWSRILKHPDTIIDGFDSFEGLPEDWTKGRPKGMFSTGGIPPKMDDNRTHFFKGRFDQTLPLYVPPKRDVLVINLDADLYSSTIYVLRSLKKLILPGTYIYFDEFSVFGHEERAFREFVDETGDRFVLRGARRGLLYVLFQCI